MWDGPAIGLVARKAAPPGKMVWLARSGFPGVLDCLVKEWGVNPGS